MPYQQIIFLLIPLKLLQNDSSIKKLMWFKDSYPLSFLCYFMKYSETWTDKEVSIAFIFPFQVFFK